MTAKIEPKSAGSRICVGRVESSPTQDDGRRSPNPCPRNNNSEAACRTKTETRDTPYPHIPHFAGSIALHEAQRPMIIAVIASPEPGCLFPGPVSTEQPVFWA